LRAKISIRFAAGLHTASSTVWRTTRRRRRMRRRACFFFYIYIYTHYTLLLSPPDGRWRTRRPIVIVLSSSRQRRPRYYLPPHFIRRRRTITRADRWARQIRRGRARLTTGRRSDRQVAIDRGRERPRAHIQSLYYIIRGTATAAGGRPRVLPWRGHGYGYADVQVFLFDRGISWWLVGTGRVCVYK